MHDDRKVEGQARGPGAGRAPNRSGWFDDETFEIAPDPTTPSESGTRALPEAVGVGLSDLRAMVRKVHLDNRGEAESKLEGSRWVALRGRPR